jgi:hypothetical protein
MKGVLQTALQYYARTRTQRWLLAGALLVFTVQRLAARLPGMSHPSWGLILPMVFGPLLVTMIVFQSALDFQRISAQRTVFLIPYSRLKLIAGMLLAQLIAAGAGSAVAALVGHAESLPPLAWGSARGTFEMLFGVALTTAVLSQIAAGPSRILSASTAIPLAALMFRPDLFMKSEIFGLPKADVLALAGMLVWIPFAAWYVIAWSPAPPYSAWIRATHSAAAAVQASRSAAIRAFLLGQPSLLRACRQKLAMLALSHGMCVAMFMGMHLFIRVPPNYSVAIMILLYSPVIYVNHIAGLAARGSRRLWLRGGGSRSMLYAIAARLGWQAVALLGIPSFALALVEIYVLPHAGMDLVYPLAVFIALTPGALYVGLLDFERRNPWTLMALLAAGVGPTLARLLVESAQVQRLLWIAPLAFVAIGGVLRELARRRWDDIDWLRFRAERESEWFALRVTRP